MGCHRETPSCSSSSRPTLGTRKARYPLVDMAARRAAMRLAASAPAGPSREGGHGAKQVPTHTGMRSCATPWHPGGLETSQLGTKRTSEQEPIGLGVLPNRLSATGSSADCQATVSKQSKPSTSMRKQLRLGRDLQGRMVFFRPEKALWVRRGPWTRKALRAWRALPNLCMDNGGRPRSLS